MCAHLAKQPSSLHVGQTHTLLIPMCVTLQVGAAIVVFLWGGGGAAGLLLDLSIFNVEHAHCN